MLHRCQRRRQDGLSDASQGEHCLIFELVLCPGPAFPQSKRNFPPAAHRSLSTNCWAQSTSQGPASQPASRLTNNDLLHPRLAEKKAACMSIYRGWFVSGREVGPAGRAACSCSSFVSLFGQGFPPFLNVLHPSKLAFISTARPDSHRTKKALT